MNFLDATAKEIVLMERTRYKINVPQDIVVVVHSNVKIEIVHHQLLFAMVLTIVETAPMRKTAKNRVQA